MEVYTANLYSEHGFWSVEIEAMRQDIKTVDGKIEKVDHKVERFEHGAKEALTDLSDRLDDVKENLKELGQGRSELGRIRSTWDREWFCETNQCSGNRLRDSIEPIYAPTLVAGKSTFALSRLPENHCRLLAIIK
jgi:hypothetical protein